ncbi:sugar porter family MFS transporter [Aspergillus undulatus]|uniref:sugar porter family MFS transporter n=1 Tax=Aspergillus undulatus TaxID=1810928 RepID=UPI003CCDE1F3
MAGKLGKETSAGVPFESVEETARPGTKLSEDDDIAEKAHAEHINLNKNLSAKIKNPLADLTETQVLRDVEEFAQEYDLADLLPDLRKGSLIARDPDNFRAVPGITPEEVQVIQDETDHKWRQPRALYFSIILCSIGAAVQGWDQTGSNGANLSMPDALGIPEHDNPHASRNQWLVGVVNAAPYIGSAVIGCWLSDPCNYYLGRRGAIFLSAIFCLITPFGQALSQTWPQLFVTRALLGIGMGLKASTIPIFCAENTPAAVRGGLVMCWQLWTAFGIFLGTTANLIVKDMGDNLAWRMQMGSAFIPAVPLILGVYMCPESPRWYIKKGNLRPAYESLCRLRNTPLQAARDLYYIYAQIKVEQEIAGYGTYLSRVGELFTIPRVRRATLASFVVMIAQQMCGINIVAFYSSSIFSQAGASYEESLWASWGFGLVNFLFAFPAVWTIDTFGRRSLLLFTFPQMAWTLLAAGFSFYIPEDSKAHLGMIALFVFLFAAFYSPGEGPVPFTYSAEVFPLSHREVGMAWAVATCLGWAAVLGITFPRMIAAMTPTGAFGFYAGLNIIALVMIFLWVPETKQRTLEELDYIFAVPTRTHMKYQVCQVLPWWFKKYVFRRKDALLEPLYKFDHVAGTQ